MDGAFFIIQIHIPTQQFDIKVLVSIFQQHTLHFKSYKNEKIKTT